MAMTSGTNKWASRAVVILQLAAWSAVGIVLLQKGVSSLQKESEPRNITQLIPISSPNFHPPEEKELSVIPISEVKPKLDETPRLQNSISSEKLQGVEMNHVVPGDFATKKNSLETSSDSNVEVEVDEPKVLESVDTLSKRVTEEKQKEETEKKSTTKKTVKLKKVSEFSTKDDEVEELLNPSNNSQRLPSMKLTDSKSPSNSNVHEQETHGGLTKTEDVSPESPHQIDITQSDNNKSNENKSTLATTPKTSTWDNRRRLRLSHLSGGGAAAAVAMVAVGAVMLVLGPAVIVLRALDERRQERRFQKLSARDDLPPTYEQATLMDEAPRYSSLSLNTILGPPPPPSPTPARVHLV